MKKMLFLIAIGMISLTAHSQVALQEEPAKTFVQDSVFAETTDTLDTVSDESLYIPESLDFNVDSLMAAWHINYHANTHINSDSSYHSVTNDEVFAERLSRLPNLIPMTFNKAVRSCISLYADRRRNLVEYMLGWADFYFPMIEEALDKNDLPLELKYVAVVESALNPVALSRAGASGLWQFILPTGKSYGLEINSLVDERRDPAKATYAACKYFKDMYAIYGDWNLVIAAYNCGPGGVNKAIKRAKGKTDFWEIYQFLPRETRTYVPLFIAANYVMSYYREHNLSPAQINLPLSTDTVIINKEIHFDQISELLKVDKELLRALNPQYKRDIVPGQYKPYVLNLPALYAYGFVELEDTIASHRAEELFVNKNQSASSKEKVRHKVQSGESVLTVANLYGVNTKEVRSWNGLNSNRVATGRTLTLYVDNGGYSFASNEQVSGMTKVESSKNIANNTTSYISYKVKSGDSFYSIAKKYPGISAQNIMKMNNMKNSYLKVGQVIKIPQE